MARLHYVHGDPLFGKTAYQYDPAKAIRPKTRVAIHSVTWARFEYWWGRILDRRSQLEQNWIINWDHSAPDKDGWYDWVHEPLLKGCLGASVSMKQFRYLVRTVGFPSYIESKRLILKNAATGQTEVVEDRSLVFFGPLEQCTTRFIDNDHRTR